MDALHEIAHATRNARRRNGVDDVEAALAQNASDQSDVHQSMALPEQESHQITDDRMAAAPGAAEGVSLADSVAAIQDHVRGAAEHMARIQQAAPHVAQQLSQHLSDYVGGAFPKAAPVSDTDALDLAIHKMATGEDTTVDQLQKNVLRSEEAHGGGALGRDVAEAASEPVEESVAATAPLVQQRASEAPHRGSGAMSVSESRGSFAAPAPMEAAPRASHTVAAPMKKAVAKSAPATDVDASFLEPKSLGGMMERGVMDRNAAMQTPDGRAFREQNNTMNSVAHLKSGLGTVGKALMYQAEHPYNSGGLPANAARDTVLGLATEGIAPAFNAVKGGVNAIRAARAVEGAEELNAGREALEGMSPSRSGVRMGAETRPASPVGAAKRPLPQARLAEPVRPSEFNSTRSGQPTRSLPQQGVGQETAGRLQREAANQNMNKALSKASAPAKVADLDEAIAKAAPKKKAPPVPKAVSAKQAYGVAGRVPKGAKVAKDLIQPSMDMFPFDPDHDPKIMNFRRAAGGK